MNLIKITLIVIVTLSLQARENPFVATQAYTEEKSILDNKAQSVLKPFNFLEISLYPTKSTLNVSKDKLFRYFMISEEKKIVLDYKGSKNILTKKINPNSKNIKLIIIADHPKENYFRVVLEYKDDIKDQKVIYNDNLVTIRNSN